MDAVTTIQDEVSALRERLQEALKTIEEQRGLLVDLLKERDRYLNRCGILERRIDAVIFAIDPSLDPVRAGQPPVLIINPNHKSERK